jgi:hypothetical protein
MKRVRQFFGTALAVIWLVSLPKAFGSQISPPNEKLSLEKTLNGQLLNVDTKAKLISVRGPDQKEIIFNYNDDTQVISPDKTVQGLTGKAGVQLRISYREERGINLATRIELIEKQ